MQTHRYLARKGTGENLAAHSPQWRTGKFSEADFRVPLSIASNNEKSEGDCLHKIQTTICSDGEESGLGAGGLGMLVLRKRLKNNGLIQTSWSPCIVDVDDSVEVIAPSL